MTLSVVSWTLGITAAEAVIQKVKALGLDGVQYAGDHRDVKAADLRKAAQAGGIRVIAIDPFNAGPGEPGKASAEAAIAYYRKVVDFAVEAGHVPVTLQGLSQWTRNCTDQACAWRRLVECCREVDRYAQARGVGTLYEVCNHYEVPLIHTASQCHALVDEVGGDNLRLILDSFHMNIDEPDPLQALRTQGSTLGIYHISDSGRAGIGSGHIDFEAQHRALHEAGFDGDVAIELVLPHLTPSNPPENTADEAALNAEIRRSADRWRGYDARR